MKPSPPLEDWNLSLPKVHQSLNDPGTEDLLPKIGDCESLDDYKTYWENLEYLLKIVIGWKNIGAGLAWWESKGREPMGDPRLELVRRVWDDEGQLDFYMAHHWREQNCFSDPEEMSPTEMSRNCRWGSEDWWRQLKRQGRRYAHDPFYGGSDPLHLASIEHCCQMGGKKDPTSYRTEVAVHHPEAVLIADDFGAWRGDLWNFANTLPPHPFSSWHVEVFERRIGYLGLYRQSRITGHWFQGKHSIHIAGNPPTSPF
ncbi:hypothetical protein ACFSSA_13080 [Luteolibacter algae]|uniref:Uncharacterized protein n=1 Tax=Luteolibacter algae TaxID=454151 RepID=A0ABW5DCG8_9BACT